MTTDRTACIAYLAEAITAGATADEHKARQVLRELRADEAREFIDRRERKRMVREATEFQRSRPWSRRGRR